MQNQLLQVKTQVAISIADQHVLEKKLQEAEENERQWMHRAGLAVDKRDDPLARAAVERSMSYKTTAAQFRQQVEDQKAQVDNLKSALLRLQQKMAEAESKSDVLIAQHRRARALGKATEAGNAMGDNSNAAAFDRMKNKVRRGEAVAQAHADLVSDDVNAKFAAMEKQEEIDRLLSELKSKRNA
jgi:phage shock protein A